MSLLTSTPCDYDSLQSVVDDITSSINLLADSNENPDVLQFKVSCCSFYMEAMLMINIAD